MVDITQIADLTTELESIKVSIRSLTVPTPFLTRLNKAWAFTFDGLVAELDLGTTRHIRKNAFKRIQNCFKHLMDDPMWVKSFHYNTEFTSKNPTCIIFTPKGYVKAIAIFYNNPIGQAYANISSELFCLYSQTVTIREKLLPLYEQQLNFLSNGTALCFWAHMTELCALHNRIAPQFSPWNYNAQVIQQLRHSGSAMGMIRRIGQNKPWAYTSGDGKQWAINEFDNLPLLPSTMSTLPSRSIRRSSTLLFG